VFLSNQGVVMRNSALAVFRRFLTRQDGAMVIIGLFLFVGMLFTASLALDMARYEQERVRLQGIADRAVLAAANMRRTNDGAVSPEEFIRGYFLSEGIAPADFDNWVRIEGDGISGRSVTITPSAQMSTMLMSLIGVDRLPLAAPARAEVGAGMQMDVVMVLDISGSMGTRTSNGLTRLENLKAAAATMVTDLTRDRRVGDVAISLIPYESWVVPPPGLLDTITNITGSGICADFRDWNDLTDFLGNATAAAAVGRNPVAANAVRRARGNARMERVNCGPAFGFRVSRPLMTDPQAMIDHINSLQTMGTTSIDMGIRYGAMMFDPDMRPYIEAEITAGRMPGELRGRPFDSTTPNVMRVMVLMTDGENCCGHRYQPSQQDTHTRMVCDNLKAEGVTVYAVAFEAPSVGVNLMSYCASSAGHFFNTNGAGLSEAFGAIGRQINAQSLRLTL
jgi:hypothetical protein